MIFQLMGGVIVAAGVFAALMWSVYQAITQRGRLQHIHIVSAVATLLAMAAISEILPFLAQILGGLLLVSATVALLKETRWNKLLPVFQIVFAAALIIGLPFTAQ